MIKVSHLNKEFNGQRVLQDINLIVADGELLVILGESGSGKSVLLQHLIGLLKPDSGEIEINGQEITRMTERQLLKVRKNIGYLFQEGALYDFMTVFENIAFPLREHTVLSHKEIAAKVHEVLDIVGLDEATNKYPSQLSGGMKKRAALARSVILGSQILFCDEPTSGLDPMKSWDIWDLIQRISRQLRCTTIVTSHDIHNAFRIADRLVLLHQGRIMTQGTPEALRNSQDALVQSFLI
jgi:phospholipid/cholesterol/gamma-HCH transport system ATP-binding protein